jgi:hypothetical protein
MPRMTASNYSNDMGTRSGYNLAMVIIALISFLLNRIIIVRVAISSLIFVINQIV